MKRFVVLTILVSLLCGTNPLDLSAQGSVHKSDGFHIGAAGYTFRKFSIDQTLESLRRLGIKYLSIKDFWLPLDATVEDMAAFRDKCASYGVDPYILGPIYMSTPEQVEEAFAYVRRFGSEMFIGVPSYDVLDLVVLAVGHFLVAVEGKVPEGTDGHVKTHCKVDVAGQVETQTGSQQHGVDQGAAGVAGFFYTEFPRKFHKGIHKVKGHYVEACGVNKGHRQVVVNRIDDSAISVPTDRDAHGGHVQRKDQVSTDAKGIAGKGVGFALAVQVPGVTGTHTGSLFARRNIGVHLDGGGE